MRGHRLLSVLFAVFALLVSAAGTGVANPLPAGWTVTPGGSFSGTGDVMFGPFVCTATSISGEFAASGTFLGTIDDAQYDNCTLGSFGWLPVDIYYSGGPWTMWGVSQDLHWTTITIEDITVDIAGIGCLATVSGSATVVHDIDDRVSVVEHDTVATYVDPANDCLGLVLEGDVVPVLSETYRISPGQVFVAG